MPLFAYAIALILTLVCSPLVAQPTPATPAAAAAAASAFSGTVRPALAQIGETLNTINIRKWKAPNEVRSAAQSDVSSIQRDLTGTLAVLLEQSDAAPGSIPAAFAVYRNVNALYDTLLRVVETAGLSAPDKEVSSLDAALRSLEGARSSLGDAILNGIEAQQAELGRLRTAIAAAATAPRTTKTTVVEDGPAPPAANHHKRTTKKRSPTSTTSTEKPKSPE